jgi:aldehyde:ferredoxin oxidoreductase
LEAKELLFGYAGKILRVNLTNGDFTEEPLQEDFVKEYIGGKGFGTKILYDEVGPDVDPLSPENKLIFAVGPATGSRFPTGGRHGVFFKSPLTGIYAESYSGGHFAPQLKFAGYDMVIIEGKAENLVYLWISDEGVEIKNASHLWRKTTYDTEDIIKEELGDKKIRVASIGPAGENMVHFAVIENDYWRSAGRCGGGAVMGSKNLKAIAARGKKRLEVANPEGLKEFIKESTKVIRTNKVLGEVYPTYGTPALVNMTNITCAFPTGYWEDGVFEDYEKINAESMREQIVIKSKACYHCPIGCGKLSEVETESGATTKVEGPEYETIYSFGGLCKINDIQEIAKINDYCDKFGIDTITTGNVVSFAIEAYKRGRLKSDVALEFGDPESVYYVMEKIVKREDFGDMLANGVRSAAEKLGLSDLAIHVKGLEPAGYDPRALYGMALGFMTSVRGACHLRSTAYMFDLRGVSGDRLAPEKKAEIVKEYEDRFAIYDSFILCRFTRDVFGWPEMLRLCKVTMGIDFTENQLRTIAERINNLARAYSVRQGLTRADDYLPKRFVEEPLKTEPLKGKVITIEDQDQMLDEYYMLRGWDTQGLPTKKKLDELKLDYVAQELSIT